MRLRLIQLKEILNICRLQKSKFLNTIFLVLTLISTSCYEILSRLTNDAIYVTAKTSGNFETLHAVVIGPFGVVYTNSFPSANGKDNFEFTIAFNKDMQPEAHVIVFYIRSTDGEIIRDDFQVKTGFDIDNSVS